MPRGIINPLKVSQRISSADRAPCAVTATAQMRCHLPDSPPVSYRTVGARYASSTDCDRRNVQAHASLGWPHAEVDFDHPVPSVGLSPYVV